MVSVTASLKLEPTSPSQSDHYLPSLLGWLHRLLAWQITLTRHTYGAVADDEYRGLYIPDAEVEILAAQMPAIPPDLAEQRTALTAQRATLEAAARTAAHIPPLLRLAQLFTLTSLESDILLLALAPELDLRYERLYAYVQDDVTRKRPSIDLALRMLVPDPEALLAARAVFAPGAPLLRHRLIQLVDDGQRQASTLARFIKIGERLTAELLQQPEVEALISPFVSLSQPTRTFDQLILPPDLVMRLRQVASAPTQRLVLALQGSYGSGRRAVTEALCTELRLPLLAVDLPRLRDSELAPVEALCYLVREATLQGAALLWQRADLLLTDDAPGPWRQAFLTTLIEHPGRSFLSLDGAWEPHGALPGVTYLRLELPAPSFSERELIWQQRLASAAPSAEVLQALASTFRLSGGQIRDAVAMAGALAHWHDQPLTPQLTPQDLYAACRAQSSGKISTLAHKIKGIYTWDDIVLPPDSICQMREICLQVRHRRTVLERWGFDRHLAMGKGVNVLFAGQSGTGKTMAAEIIAADLGLELYKVDLSSLVSKYIGETEKNLDRIFTAAREANAILFFDEADAIFGKRSEVKDAHDRYANIEVGYLLQKMEEYDGVVILATNLRKNLDDAFVRRLHVAIDFPFPEEPDRLRIWSKVFPADAPLAEGVDAALLARQFKLAGGNIRNIALLSAYLAAEDGDIITMSHLIRAIKREYQKLGKLVTAAEFGQWMSIVKG